MNNIKIEITPELEYEINTYEYSVKKEFGVGGLSVVLTCLKDLIEKAKELNKQ